MILRSKRPGYQMRFAFELKRHSSTQGAQKEGNAYRAKGIRPWSRIIGVSILVMPRMAASAVIDPDQFLDFDRTTPFSREEGKAAWEMAYASLEHHLAALGHAGTLVIVFGLQASGKSAWVRQHATTAPEGYVYFSGPLPSRAHRRRALEIAQRHGCRAIGVWLKVPLDVALKRNRARTGLAQVPEEVVLHVHESFQPPLCEEGFDEVSVVEAATEA